ncbi:MAG: rubrerythrin family protein, partial [Nitrospiraceae bacterium]|nr:rubrerythrin family protein [Nitrospiraceae bacterium]
MLKTDQNLQDAFAGESQANRKYLAFARQAEDEGYAQVARLFRAAAAAETIHAHNHLKGMKGVKSTKENLVAAISGESYEFQKMYPQMITDAKAEGQDYALRSFSLANEVEKVHAALYKKAL